MPRFEKPASEYIEKLVYLNRVSKTVKGGRIMKFSAPDGSRRRQGQGRLRPG